MVRTYSDNTCEVYTTQNGGRVVITKDECTLKYFNVWAKSVKDKKGKIIATRCTLEKSHSIAAEYETKGM